ncbi:MAG TPA: DUF2804 domain-containing protein [Nocardia sp.]|uniref:DUF2804 domain-containing protein n=1 Tax=Nocardia TaxID=1817 RepID=UPI0024584FD8|nr:MULTISPECIES: DUF2804 domain-containing protein [Nocardia]HLS77681.1 DUF2804 domain-containing protein [Nocardia sp.]
MSERELTAPVDLCDARGRLNPEAVGWSRRPLHRANLSGAWGRKKRWDYWAVTAPDLYLAITCADLDYLGNASVWLCGPSKGLSVAVDRIVPAARGFALPDQPCTGLIAVEAGGLRIEIDERASGSTRLRARCDRTPEGPLDIEVEVAEPAGHESLNVVIPWSPRRFQFTSKQNTRPATGTVRLGEHRWELGGAEPGAGELPAYGTLDLGRGVWKYRNRWNWAAASGVSRDGRTVGLQFGGKWTEGTGYTENGLCVDGRLTKIGEELRWDYDWDHPMRPWRVRDSAGLVDVELVPDHDRHARTDAGLISMEVHQCFGRWSGTIVTEAGERVEFADVIGFAEEARNRW